MGFVVRHSVPQARTEADGSVGYMAGHEASADVVGTDVQTVNEAG